MEIFDGCIGIDLGTTYSCVAVMLGDRVEIIPNSLGNRITPSFVAFTDNERLVGEAAKNQASNNHLRTLYDIKRIIGHHYSDNEIQHDLEDFPFTIIPDEHDSPLIQVKYHDKTQQFRPEQISALVLEKMKDTAETYLGKKVKKAVVTVPAYFKDAQKQATQHAAKIAGLDCLRIINEPTAACLCYGLEKSESGTILIFDLGGGTFDVSILEISKGLFEVKSTSGDTHLGGEDFDQRLLEYCCQDFHRRHGKDLHDNDKAIRRLLTACERAKRELSEVQTTQIEVDALHEGVDFQIMITRSRFEMLCQDLFKKCIQPVEQALADADLMKDEIDEIVLVGGSTRIPKIREILSHFFKGKKLNQSVNPDEAVAYGAAIQGEILTHGENSKVKDILLLDVNSLSTGVEAHGGIMSVIIPRNSTLPAHRSQMYTTVDDNQTSVKIKVYEGERRFTKDNHILGEFELTIQKAPRGVPKIEVTFDVGADGILNVSAVDKQSGLTNQITLTPESGRLSSEEIQKMIEDAERFRARDEIRKDALDSLNAFERYLNHVQITVNDTEHNGGLSEEQINYTNQYVLNSLEWIDTQRQEEVTGISGQLTRETVEQAKRTIEGELKEILLQVYCAMERQPEPSVEIPTAQVAEQMMDQMDQNSADLAQKQVCDSKSPSDVPTKLRIV